MEIKGNKIYYFTAIVIPKLLSVFLLVGLLIVTGCYTPKKPIEKVLPAQSVIAAKSRLKLASFNIRVFSNNSRRDEELNRIADILKQYDIIAIQELRDELVLQRTVDMLKSKGIDYGYEISPPVGKGVKERYAFLYRKDRVVAVMRGKFYREHNDEFIREPFYATFKSGNFDFTLITIHTLYGKSEDLRRPEIEALKAVFS